LPAAVGMVLTGKVRDAKTISSVLWLDHVTRAHGGKLTNARSLR
jgi:hypothetical protein